MPEWMQALGSWMLQPVVLTVGVAASALLFALSVAGVPIVLKRMPADFFSRPERHWLDLTGPKQPFRSVVVHVLKNLLGSVLLALGLLMLFVPGQGLLTIFVALLLIEFPGKRRLQRWVISRPCVHTPINTFRRRAGRPPLELPG